MATAMKDEEDKVNIVVLDVGSISEDDTIKK